MLTARKLFEMSVISLAFSAYPLLEGSFDEKMSRVDDSMESAENGRTSAVGKKIRGDLLKSDPENTLGILCKRLKLVPRRGLEPAHKRLIPNVVSIAPTWFIH